MKSIMKLCLICLVLLALHPEEVFAISLDKASQNLRQPSYKDKKEKNEPNREDVPAVVKVENHARNHHKKVMDAIDTFRAKVCAEMKDEFGVKFTTFEQCHQFMEKTCKPGKDMMMDGDHHEVSSGKGYCREYFPEAEKKAEEAVEKEEKEVIPVAPAPSPFPGPAPAPKAEEKAPAPAPTVVASAPAGAGPAPSPGPMGGPSPAPVPSPFIPGISAGKPWGPIGKDEAWYYEKGGKDIARMHMDEGQKLPTHGYWGDLVEHDDMQTATGDWQVEFGPKSGHNIVEACLKHPDNPWCIRKGFGRRSGSSLPLVAHFAPMLIAFLAVFVIQ